MHDLADDDGVDALFLEVGTHGDQQQIDGVVAVEGLQNIRPAGGEQAAVVLFQGGGDAGGRHAEGHQIVIFIHDEAGELGLDEGGKLPGVLADLVVRQLHGAVQGGIGHVHQLKDLPDQGRVLQTAAHLMDVQALPLQNIGGDLLPALDDPLVRGDGDEILGPVHVLAVAQSRQVVNIVGVVIIGKEAAGAVKALHQHPLPVHVGEAQRAVDLRAAQLTGPVLHRLEQGGGYLPVVDEVHLRETQAVGTPLVVGFTAEDGTDAAHQRAVIPQRASQ